MRGPVSLSRLAFKGPTVIGDLRHTRVTSKQQGNVGVSMKTQANLDFPCIAFYSFNHSFFGGSSGVDGFAMTDSKDRMRQDIL